ncbi:MAG: FtsQ-type POTRA domain-containing protein [Erysipelotrichaceae bacterium]|nr:FtsQ-type POTRA domain-containing protein [Erysipelotrichaceae bacterium]
MTKKKKKKRIFKIKNIIILLMILLLMVGLFYYAITMPIKNIYIKGNKIISDNEIMEISSLDKYPSFLLTKKSQLKKTLEKNDYIKEVKISKKLGNIIELTITEYQAVALTVDGNMILSNGTVLENTYNLTDIPIMINTIDENKTFKNFANKFGQINNNILRQISQIEYSPVEVDEDRFLLYMNDGNLVYITLTKINKLNKYDKIKDKLNGQLGIIYLDSGDYVELKKNTIATNSTTVTDPNNESDQSTDE